jgi:hypothetical protein
VYGNGSNDLALSQPLQQFQEPVCSSFLLPEVEACISAPLIIHLAAWTTRVPRPTSLFGCFCLRPKKEKYILKNLKNLKTSPTIFVPID